MAVNADGSAPDVGDPQLILKGAGQYAVMCTKCRLAPEVNDSELWAGLYPQPPNLTRIDARDAFWVFKHGIGMSGMAPGARPVAMRRSGA